MKKSISPVFIALFLLSAHGAAGHSFGYSMEQVKDNYLIDINYDSRVIEAGAPVRFEFYLKSFEDIDTSDLEQALEGEGEMPHEVEDRLEDVDFEYVWVRIVESGNDIDQNKTVFAGGIHKQEIGPTGMMFTFPEAGEYEMQVRFISEAVTIVDNEFSITVEGDTQSRGLGLSFYGVFIFLAILAVGVFVGVIVANRTKFGRKI